MRWKAVLGGVFRTQQNGKASFVLSRHQPSKLDVKGCVAGWTINPACTWLSLHSQLPVTTGATDFHFGYVWSECELMSARSTFEVCRTLVHSDDKDLARLRAAYFFILPLLASDWMFNTDLCITKSALDFTKTARQQPVAFWTCERWRGHTRFNG